MNSREQQFTTSFSSRTLQHPSFMPLYAGFPHSQTEVFYTDPSMDYGRRIYNRLSGQRRFDCSRLNTPPPIMSSCQAPPNFPDPFRFGPHPIRDLGSPTWRIHTIHSLVQPRWIILQLDQEDDQAITNLLKLRHQSLESDEDFTADFTGACLGWSDTELEVANTLSSRFDIKEDDFTTKICCTPECCQTDIEEDSSSSSSPRRSGDLLEMKIQRLSDSEGVAVLMLLSLGDMGALDVVQ